MKRIIILLLLIWLLATAFSHALAAAEPEWVEDRPVPTGCPYADQIPVDSPKCVPPTAEQLEPWVDTDREVFAETWEPVQGK